MGIEIRLGDYNLTNTQTATANQVIPRSQAKEMLAPTRPLPLVEKIPCSSLPARPSSLGVMRYSTSG